jgi:hypothetical protein
MCWLQQAPKKGHTTKVMDKHLGSIQPQPVLNNTPLQQQLKQKTH